MLPCIAVHVNYFHTKFSVSTSIVLVASVHFRPQDNVSVYPHDGWWIPFYISDFSDMVRFKSSSQPKESQPLEVKDLRSTLPMPIKDVHDSSPPPA